MFVLGVVGGIGQSWHTAKLVQAVLDAAEARPEVEVRLLDLSQTPIEFAANKAQADYDKATQEAIELTAKADALVFGSPIYRAAYTGVLKNYFDLLPVEALLGKTAALVATGASTHHFLSLDLIFRPLLTFFNMHSVPGVLYGSREQFLPEKALNDQLLQQAETLGRDLVYMAEQLKGRGWGPASPGIAATINPR